MISRHREPFSCLSKDLALAGVVITSGTVRPREAVEVSVKMDCPRGGITCPRSRSVLESLRRCHTRAEHTAHDGGWTVAPRQIHGAVGSARYAICRRAGARPMKKRSAFSASGCPSQRMLSSKLVQPVQSSAAPPHAERRDSDRRNGAAAPLRRPSRGHRMRSECMRRRDRHPKGNPSRSRHPRPPGNASPPVRG